MRKRSIPERVREGDTGHVGPTSHHNNIIVDVLAEKARTKTPWAMLFADDLVRS